jgi:hypothetical protein
MNRLRPTGVGQLPEMRLLAQILGQDLN